MGRQPRAAGRRFEQRVARDLREALGPAWTVTRNQTDRQKGQTGCAGEFTIDGPVAFPFAIECKDGHGFKLGQLWADPVPGPLATTPSKEGFWAQAVRQAESVGKRPMLIFREAGSRVVLCAVEEHWADSRTERPMGRWQTLVVGTDDGPRVIRIMRWQDVVKHAGRWV